MSLKLLILLSGFPVFILGKYIYDKDKNKEPNKLLTKLFIGGMGACIITIIFTYFLGLFFPILLADPIYLNNLDLIVYVFLGIALIEEYSKWLIIYIFSFNNNEFNEVYDCIVYSTYVSLGFAFFENIFYVLSGGISIAILRALTAVPLHTCFGIFMAKFLIIAKQNQFNENHLNKIKNFILSILIPMILHGIYDYLIFAGFYILDLFFLIVMFLISIKEIKKYIY